MRTKYFLAEGSSTIMQKSPLNTAKSAPAGFANEILKSQADDHIAKILGRL